MKIFKCEKCNSTDVFIQHNETHYGLYCGDCGKWIKWLNKDELRLAVRQINPQSQMMSDTDILAISAIVMADEAKIRADERRKFADKLLNHFTCKDENGFITRQAILNILSEYEKGQKEGGENG